jgi:hypothetical protein
MGETSALIGYTGFVGQALLRQRSFGACFNSANIGDIAGQAFDEVVCAGAPATMWAANNDPDGDRANIERLVGHLSRASVGRLILISTIAVLDDVSAGYTERTACFETRKPYGRNRRWLEEAAASLAAKTLIVRLPALFGAGLKKNFIFDLLNPSPSFLKPEAFAVLNRVSGAATQALLERVYAFDASLSMWRLDRDALGADRSILDGAVRHAGLEACRFTHSDSTFQFYDVSRLASDIAVVVASDIDAINICSEPMRAADIHVGLLGEPFFNSSPTLVTENVKSAHAGIFGHVGPYLLGADETMHRLRTFFASEQS